MSNLIVILPLSTPDASVEYDYVLSTGGNTVARAGRVAAPLLPSVAQSAVEVVAVAPAQALSWPRAYIPM